jgi:hypothetical protein
MSTTRVEFCRTDRVLMTQNGPQHKRSLQEVFQCLAPESCGRIPLKVDAQ